MSNRGGCAGAPSKIAITLHARGACNLSAICNLSGRWASFDDRCAVAGSRGDTVWRDCTGPVYTRRTKIARAQRLQSSLPSPSSKAERLSCHLRRTIRLPGRLASRRLVSVARVDQGGLSSVSETSRMTRPRRSGRPKNGTRRPMSTGAGFTRPSRHRNYPAPRSRVILS